MKTFLQEDHYWSVITQGWFKWKFLWTKILTIILCFSQRRGVLRAVIHNNVTIFFKETVPLLTQGVILTEALTNFPLILMCYYTQNLKASW